MQPRSNENGGAYGQGVIVRSYRTGSNIDISVELTANHKGFFEFRLCPLDEQTAPETDECFNRHVLRTADGKGTK